MKENNSVLDNLAASEKVVEIHAGLKRSNFNVAELGFSVSYLLFEKVI